MPNTKKLPKEARKRSKRAARKALHELRASMTRDERKAFAKEEKASLKVFLTRRRAEARAAAAKKEEAPAAGGGAS
ncbi:MAG: hypothetical protein JXQ29_17900 [Planctomycetes bacterium]|nr:hypothetical protein [Planctomycetota bacterium]